MALCERRVATGPPACAQAGALSSRPAQRLLIPICSGVSSITCPFSLSTSFMNCSLRWSTTLFSLKYLIQLVAQLSSNLWSCLEQCFSTVGCCLGSRAFTTPILSRHWKYSSLASQHCFLELLLFGWYSSFFSLLNHPMFRVGAAVVCGAAGETGHRLAFTSLHLTRLPRRRRPVASHGNANQARDVRHVPKSPL